MCCFELGYSESYEETSCAKLFTVKEEADLCITGTRNQCRKEKFSCRIDRFSASSLSHSLSLLHIKHCTY